MDREDGCLDSDSAMQTSEVASLLRTDLSETSSGGRARKGEKAEYRLDVSEARKVKVMEQVRQGGANQAANVDRHVCRCASDVWEYHKSGPFCHACWFIQTVLGTCHHRKTTCVPDMGMPTSDPDEHSAQAQSFKRHRATLKIWSVLTVLCQSIERFKHDQVNPIRAQTVSNDMGDAAMEYQLDVIRTSGMRIRNVVRKRNPSRRM